VIVIEHNLDVIKTADWLIDMGPAGGHRGGLIVAAGTPEEVAEVPDSYTGDFLRPVLRLKGRAKGGADATARAEKANGGNGNGTGNGTKPVKRAASKSPVKRAAAARR